MSQKQSWEGQANNWMKWARTPDLDVFPYYAPSFLEEILPSPKGVTLEVGCGEGRVARLLTSHGHSMVAFDASRTLVRSAREADGHSVYLLGDATSLPFADASFQTVVAYNSLQTMVMQDDMPRAVREAGRVLKPLGHLCFVVAHPMTDVARIRQTAANEDLVLSGSYFDNRRVEETVTKGGLEMTFHGWTYTLEDYARALENAGLFVERVREPVPSEEQVTNRPGGQDLRRLPLFLFIRAVKPAT